MNNKIIINVIGIGEIEIDSGTSLLDISKTIFKDEFKTYLGARINNEIFNLYKTIDSEQEIKFIDNKDVDGYRIYTKTITAVFIMACEELFPELKVRIQHFQGPGLYAEMEKDSSFSSSQIQLIEEKMRQIIELDYTIERTKYGREEAISIFEEIGYVDKVRLYNSIDREKFHIYKINQYIDAFHGYLAPSTGYVKMFQLKYYYPGVIILFPSKKNNYDMTDFTEQKKLAKIFKESNDWAEILDLSYVSSLNEKVNNNTIDDVIRVSEALHEKKIAKIADLICEDSDINIILIAGPTSSGKTTFANRLAVQLKVNGKRPIAISIDDYFVNREDSPLNEDGTFNFETIHSVDLELLNRDLTRLLEGEIIELPRFNFITGQREMSGVHIKVDKNHPIIVEGIHGLNPMLTSDIPEKNKYKIYISALTQLNIDAHNRIATTDTRLIRRMVRDVKYRGNGPLRTFELWDGVRSGEEKHIFPYQEEADIMFDSALVYELAVLKKYILPLLNEIENDSIYYSEAKKLIKFLQYFVDIVKEEDIPPTSLLREFI